MSTVQANIAIHTITETNGYIEINNKNISIPIESDLILHHIDTKEITNILLEMRNDLKMLYKNEQIFLNNEIEILLSKLKSITPINRQKRGLINIVGNAYKYLFGTMDNTDQEDITNHFNTVDTNIHNSITGLNQQIKINDHFNKTIQLIKETLTQNQQSEMYHFNGLHKSVKDVLKRNIYLEKLLILTTIKTHIEHIQSYIATAQNRISDASILTKQEIDDYDINISKIKYLRTAILEKNNDLIFLVKIPKNFEIIRILTIIPMPNQNKEIEAEIESIFHYNNKTYEYKENSYINECKISKHCTTDKTCKLITNNDTEIVNINEDIIIVKNAKNDTITSDYNNTNNILNGNFLIQYNNCSLKIANQNFSNKNKIYLDKIIIPKFQNITFNTTLTIEEVKLTTIQNLKEIEEIKYNNKVITYSVPPIIIITIAIILLIIFYVKCKASNGRIRENPSSNGGGVTYVLPQPPLVDVNNIIAKYSKQT